MTMTTVGYGDIVPQNDTEKIVNMLMMVLACAAFGFIINQISGIIADLEDRSIMCSKELNVINRYMENYNIDQDLRIKIRNHLKTQWKTNVLS